MILIKIYNLKINYQYYNLKINILFINNKMKNGNSILIAFSNILFLIFLPLLLRLCFLNCLSENFKT